MRQTRPVILSCFFLWAAVIAPGWASPVTALRIRHKAYDAETGKLSYELVNDSNQTITAWRLSLARGDRHGHGASSVLDQDFAIGGSREANEREAGPIAPGAGFEDTWRLDRDSGDAGPAVLSLAVTAVVFEDLGWQGDTLAVQTILEARALRIRDLERLLGALESADRRPRSRQSWSAELGAEAQRLRSESREVGADKSLRPAVAAQVSATRLALADWLEQAGREILVAPDPQESLRTLTRDLRQRFETGLRSIPSPSPGSVPVPGSEGGSK